jgi:hypothetical protein
VGGVDIEALHMWASLPPRLVEEPNDILIVVWRRIDPQDPPALQQPPKMKEGVCLVMQLMKDLIKAGEIPPSRR